MANYTIQASPAWNARDALAQGHADKVVSGQLFHDEFTAIADAIDDKAELAGSSTQQFEASTPSAGDDTNKVATTAFVRVVVEGIYPIGSLYTTTDSTSPSASTRLGFGTWEAFGQGRVLIGVGDGTDDNETKTFASGETGGEYNHTLTVSEMPSHTHTEEGVATTGDDATSVGGGVTELQSSGNNTSETGGGQAHNNLQPYVVVYMWKRTA